MLVSYLVPKGHVCSQDGVNATFPLRQLSKACRAQALSVQLEQLRRRKLGGPSRANGADSDDEEDFTDDEDF